MKINRYKILSIIFVVILVTPTVMFPILRGVLKTEKSPVDENRYLAKFTPNFNKFGSAIEDYYNDHFPFRSSFIRTYNKIYSKLINPDLIQPPPPPPVINELTAEDLAGFERYMRVLVEGKNYFNALGKEVYFVIMPTKSTTQGDTIYNKYDYMCEYFRRNSDLAISYQRNETIAAMKSQSCFYKYDWHINFLGAYLSYIGLQKSLGLPIIDYTQLEIKAKQITTTEPAISANGYVAWKMNGQVPQAMREETFYQTDYDVFYKPNVKQTNRQAYMSGNGTIEVTSDSPNNKTVLSFGDSFTRLLSPYLLADFNHIINPHPQSAAGGKAYTDPTYRAEIRTAINAANVIIIECQDTDMSKTMSAGQNTSMENYVKFLMAVANEN